jgi:hypothetical protein
MKNIVTEQLESLEVIIDPVYLKQIYKKIRKSLSIDKVYHSIRTASYAIEFTNSPDAIIVALCHDYLEAGGSLLKLDVSDRIKELLMCLTIEKYFNEYDNPSLCCLHYKIPRLPTDMKKDLIYAKISDRLDNCIMKANIGILKDNYIEKTKNLLFMLYNNFPNNKTDLREKILEKFIPINPGFIELNKILFAFNN